MYHDFNLHTPAINQHIFLLSNNKTIEEVTFISYAELTDLYWFKKTDNTNFTIDGDWCRYFYKWATPMSLFWEVGD